MWASQVVLMVKNLPDNAGDAVLTTGPPLLHHHLLLIFSFHLLSCLGASILNPSLNTVGFPGGSNGKESA